MIAQNSFYEYFGTKASIMCGDKDMIKNYTYCEKWGVCNDCGRCDELGDELGDDCSLVKNKVEKEYIQDDLPFTNTDKEQDKKFEFGGNTLNGSLFLSKNDEELVEKYSSSVSTKALLDEQKGIEQLTASITKVDTGTSILEADIVAGIYPDSLTKTILNIKEGYSTFTTPIGRNELFIWNSPEGILISRDNISWIPPAPFIEGYEQYVENMTYEQHRFFNKIKKNYKLPFLKVGQKIEIPKESLNVQVDKSYVIIGVWETCLRVIDEISNKKFIANPHFNIRYLDEEKNVLKEFDSENKIAL